MAKGFEALGITGRSAVFQLLTSILQNDTEAALKHVQGLYRDGRDLKLFGQEFLEAVRDVLVYKLVGASGFPDWGDAEREQVASLIAAEPVHAANVAIRAEADGAFECKCDLVNDGTKKATAELRLAF